MADEGEFHVAFVVLASMLLILEFLLGLSFNIIVLVISLKSLKNTDERGNTFISNLNVVDVVICLTAVPMTLTMVLTSRFKGALFCFFMEGIISLVCVASSMTLLMICLDRYYAVVTPTKRQVFTTKVTIVIALIWSLALFAFCTPFIGFDQSTINSLSTNKSFSCNQLMSSLGPYYFYELFYVLTFAITTIGMIMFFVAILRVARKRVAIQAAIVVVSLSSQGQSRRELARDQERKLLRLSLVVVVTFMCLWGPHVVVTVLEMVLEGNLSLETAQLCCQVVAYSTTIAHPLLYAFMRKKVRKALRQKLTREATIVQSTGSAVNHNARDKQSQ
ncbi:G-protein coupled receptor 22-like [Haliotis asinina]|uniref:G-protein coupled receptor 22-like n=1 Tax=Haliotis asinina TaxID=109174 RepID=UPI00353219AC